MVLDISFIFYIFGIGERVGIGMGVEIFFIMVNLSFIEVIYGIL